LRVVPKVVGERASELVAVAVVLARLDVVLARLDVVPATWGRECLFGRE
jgi:hypothetical protein